MTELTDKVALVTGGGRGIGRAAALELARRGAKIILVARSLGEIEAVAAEIRELNRPVLAVETDLSQGEQVIADLMAKIEAEFGQVEILVNNAAIAGPYGPTWELDPAEWEQAIKINLFAPFRLVRATLPGMQAQGWGRIINISSGAARNPMERTGAYSVSKAAIDMFSRQLGQELGDSGVVTISLYPGLVDTSMQTSIRQQPVEKVGAPIAERFRNYYESGQTQSPERPGRLIAILAGEVGADKNGQILDIYDPAMQTLLEQS